MAACRGGGEHVGNSWQPWKSFIFVRVEMECVCVFTVERGCFVLSKLWKLEMKQMYNQCQQIMSLSLCISDRVLQCWLKYMNMVDKSAAVYREGIMSTGCPLCVLSVISRNNTTSHCCAPKTHCPLEASPCLFSLTDPTSRSLIMYSLI